MNSLIFTKNTTRLTPKQMNSRRSLFLGMLRIIEKGSPSAEKYTQILDKYLTCEDLAGMSMDEVYRFSCVCEDVSMIEFFSRRELVEAGYMTREEMRMAEFEAMNAEVI